MIDPVTVSWSAFVAGDKEAHDRLIFWKLGRFQKIGWGGTNLAKWGATASSELPLSDAHVPIACVSVIGGAPAGVAFIINNDLANYPVDGVLAEPFTAALPIVGESANPWFAGQLVDEPYRRLGIGRNQEQWLIQHATKLADAGHWPYPRRRLWLFTEREPLDFLPEMYQRSGWLIHRTFQYQGLQRWVMYLDF